VVVEISAVHMVVFGVYEHTTPESRSVGIFVWQVLCKELHLDHIIRFFWCFGYAGFEFSEHYRAGITLHMTSER